MANKKRTLNNAFEQFSNKTEGNETVNNNQVDVKEDVIQESNIETVQDTSQASISKDTVVLDNVEGNSSLTVKQVSDELLSMYEEKTKKKTVEQTHTRTTFLFRNDLAKRLDRISKGKRGFKTLLLNKAIETLLDEMEGK